MKKYVRRPTEEEFHYKILMVSEESRWIYLMADQWDTCFGITVAYPKDVSSSAALDFLNKYL